ncbi:hypothetical protein VIGAN_07111900, partial [Vigna angularis var. angularis]
TKSSPKSKPYNFLPNKIINTSSCYKVLHPEPLFPPSLLSRLHNERSLFFQFSLFTSTLFLFPVMNPRTIVSGLHAAALNSNALRWRKPMKSHAPRTRRRDEEEALGVERLPEVLEASRRSLNSA